MKAKKFTPLAASYQTTPPSTLMRLFPELTFAAIFSADGAAPVLAVDADDLPSYEDAEWSVHADAAWDFFFDVLLVVDGAGLPSTPVTLASFLDDACYWDGSTGALYLPLRFGEFVIEPTSRGALVRPEDGTAFEITSRGEWDRFLRYGGAGDRFVDYMAEVIDWEALSCVA